MKTFLDGKRYLVIVRQDFFNPIMDKTLLEEDQIECFGIKEYSHPRIFGGKMLIDARDQVGNYLKISISWY